MSKPRARSKASKPPPANTLVVKRASTETEGAAMARVLLGPYVRHGVAASTYANRLINFAGEQPGIMDFAEFVKDLAEQAKGGDLSLASRILAAQAVTLDTMFTEFAKRAALNIGEHLGAVDSYGRMAMKAQANCRATLDVLAKLHQPREQTVRHVHVNEGGQAVVAEQFHHHAGGDRNAKSNEQSHAPQSTRATGSSTTLPRPDAVRHAVPSASGERPAPMPNARGPKSWSA
ncbi:MAG: hypothetical protein RJP95_03545 [Pirellulales bacterium]